MLRHTCVTTMLDAGVSLRGMQIAARHADREPPCATTEFARTSTGTPNTSWPRTWPPAGSRRSRLCREEFFGHPYHPFPGVLCRLCLPIRTRVGRHRYHRIL